MHYFGGALAVDRRRLQSVPSRTLPTACRPVQILDAQLGFYVVPSEAQDGRTGLCGTLVVHRTNVRTGQEPLSRTTDLRTGQEPSSSSRTTDLRTGRRTNQERRVTRSHRLRLTEHTALAANPPGSDPRSYREALNSLYTSIGSQPCKKIMHLL